jgi:alkylresorcinol/alkylpyrone synthase
VTAPIIHGIATALPPFSVTAEEAQARLEPFFVGTGEDPALVRQIFQSCGIDRRWLARPASYYLEERSLTARNATYAQVARELGVEAARRVLDETGLAPSDIDLIIDTSCTGVMIPALDVYVSNALGMRKDVRRIPLTEAGCAAGATSLALAHELIQARPGSRALLLSVELPSLTLQLDDTSRANLVSSALFGDGAAALVVSDRPTPRHPLKVALEHLAHRATLFPGTTDIMGFDLKTEGFKIILSPRIPMLVARELGGAVDAFLEEQGLARSQLGFFVVHPGGTKVLDNVRDTLGLKEEQVAASRRTLRDCGNLSSAAVHFAAKDLLAHGEVARGAFGLMIAMGPGFTVELALLRGC